MREWERSGDAPPASALTGYGVVKDALHAAQHQKCAYCEWGVPAPYHDVEHFRPKSSYWWLTWHWENMLFACVYCNRTHKRTRFPIVGGPRLAVGEDPQIGSERPALLDPSDPSVTPSEEIEFVEVAGVWRPVARAGSVRGNATIRICGLDQPPILDEYQRYVRDVLGRLADDVLWALEDPSGRDLRRAWAQAVASCEPERIFAGLARDYLAARLPGELRSVHGLALPVGR